MPESILTLPPPPYDLRIRYGEAPQHFADVRLPPGDAPGLAVIVVHGGYWRSRYDLAYMGHFCADLTNAGIVTVNLEYRRVGDPGGGWPGTFDDVRRAFSFVLEHARELRIDMDQPIQVAGHSAGAQLAMCLATHEPRVARVLLLAGVLDLRRAWELHLSNDAVVEFLGGTPEQAPEHYRAASPMELPLRTGKAPGSRTLSETVLHGTNDDVVPIEFSRQYVEHRRKLGGIVEFVELPGADHYDLIDPAAKFWQELPGPGWIDVDGELK